MTPPDKYYDLFHESPARGRCLYNLFRVRIHEFRKKYKRSPKITEAIELLKDGRKKRKLFETKKEVLTEIRRLNKIINRGVKDQKFYQARIKLGKVKAIL